MRSAQEVCHHVNDRLLAFSFVSALILRVRFAGGVLGGVSTFFMMIWIYTHYSPLKEKSARET